MTPTWRKPAGTLLIVVMITVWAVLIATLADTVIGWPIALQTLFYLAVLFGFVFEQVFAIVVSSL